MESKKHYINVFFTDNKDFNILNFDGGCINQYAENFWLLQTGIGGDIYAGIQECIESGDAAIYGCRVDYTLTPITENPYK